MIDNNEYGGVITHMCKFCDKLVIEEKYTDLFSDITLLMGFIGKCPICVDCAIDVYNIIHDLIELEEAISEESTNFQRSTQDG